MGPEGILTGSARIINEKNKKISAINLQREMERKDREIARKREILEASIKSLKNEFASVEEELSILKATESLHLKNGVDKTSKKLKK